MSGTPNKSNAKMQRQRGIYSELLGRSNTAFIKVCGNSLVGETGDDMGWERDGKAHLWVGWKYCGLMQN